MQVDLVKIDVEDFGADVLAGMQEVIRRDRPFIVCEVLPPGHRNERTRDILAALGYQPYWITPSGYIRFPASILAEAIFRIFCRRRSPRPKLFCGISMFFGI